MLLGLGSGALFASLAVGLVLTHRSSGVINLAHGATAMFAAVIYRELRTTGRLIVPPLPNPLAPIEGIADRFFGAQWKLPDWPVFIKLGGPWGTWQSILGALVVAALVGLALHLFIFRPLRDATQLAKLVATVGVLLTLQAIVALRAGTSTQTVDSILTRRSVAVFGTHVPADRFVLAALVVVVAVLLWALGRFTRFGLSSRAAAEDQDAAALLGYSPDRLGAISWMLAAVIAGLFGILAAPITSVTPTNFSLFIIPALAAAATARFNSFGIAVGVGLAIGMLDSLLIRVESLSAFGWLPRNSRSLLPFLILAVVVALGNRAVPSRGSTGQAKLPDAPISRVSPSIMAGALFVVLVPAAIFLPYEWRQAMTTSLIATVIALSLVVLAGYVGQVSIAQLAVSGTAAFALAEIGGRWDLPFPIVGIVAILIAAAAGLAVGLPSLRIKGLSLAIVTFAFAAAVDGAVFSNPELVGSGARRAPPPSIAGFEFGPFSSFPLGDDSFPSQGFGLLVVVVAVATLWMVANLRRSSSGRQMLAVRANERAAMAGGINVARTKMVAFGISSAVAGLGGVLLAYQTSGGVNPASFTALGSLGVLALTFLGGITMLSGAVFAGVISAGGLAALIGSKAADVDHWLELISGVSLLVAVVRNPDGVMAMVLRGVAGTRQREAR